MEDKKKPSTNDFFKEDDILVYAVHYNNGKSYEYQFDCIDAIFLTWDDAVNYIEEIYPNSKKEYLKDLVWDFKEYNLHVNMPIWKDDDYYYSEIIIEIWNATTGTRVHFDNEHIFKIEEDQNDQTDSISEE